MRRHVHVRHAPSARGSPFFRVRAPFVARRARCVRRPVRHQRPLTADRVTRFAVASMARSIARGTMFFFKFQRHATKFLNFQIRFNFIQCDNAVAQKHFLAPHFEFVALNAASASASLRHARDDVQRRATVVDQTRASCCRRPPSIAQRWSAQQRRCCCCCESARVAECRARRRETLRRR